MLFQLKKRGCLLVADVVGHLKALALTIALIDI
jgi:hypothetical protein